MADFLFRLTRVILVLAAAFGLAFWLFSTREAPQRQMISTPPPGVSVIQVKPESLAMTVQAFGTIVPGKKVNIAAEVAGRINHIHPGFREGEKVNTDDLLINIDQRRFRLDQEAARVQTRQARADISHLAREIENLKAEAELARTSMALSLKELNRIRALSKSQFASKTAQDKAEQQYLTARIQLQIVENRLALTPSRMALKEAALAMARNDLAKADLVLEKSEIRSGFDGYVLLKKAEMGEYVNPGQVLGVIYKQGELEVDLGLPIEDLKWLKPAFDQGAMPSAQVRIANMAPGRSPVWPARVTRIKANIDEKTRTLPITLEILSTEAGLPDSGSAAESGTPAPGSNPLMRLRPGAFVSCRILGRVHPSIFRLPRYLLRAGDTLYTVRDGHLDIRKVSVLRKFEEEVFINNGLSSADLVVTSPLPGAKPGMAVSVTAGPETDSETDLDR